MCKFGPIYKQFLMIISCNILSFSFGFSSGWATINLPELESKNSTFPFTLSKDEAALVISFQYLGSILGNYLTLPISQAMGAKRTIHLFGIPMIISPFLIIWATNVYCFYVSRVLIGMTFGALVVVLPALVSELCFDKVRGALNAICDMMKNFGLIASFMLGSYLNCMQQAFCQLIPLTIFIGIMFLLPNTPEYWMKRNDKQRAIKSQRFYKGINTTLNVRNESDFHPLSQIEQDVRLGAESENACNNNDDVTNSKLRFSDFFTQHAKKSFFIITCIQILYNLCGTLQIVGFLTNIFKETGSILTEKDSSLFIVVVQLIANLVFLAIVERFNRRTLYVGSALLTTASYALFAAYGFLWSKQSGLEWMPPICIAAVFFFGSMGILPLPYVIMAELLPRKICKPSFSFFATLFWLLMFLNGSIFLTMVEMIGIYSCVIAFALHCILNALFAIVYLPETRKKSFDEIEEMMKK